MAYIDEHGKEHCCEECANKKKPIPVEFVLGATALAAVSLAAGFMVFNNRRGSPSKQGES